MKGLDGQKKLSLNTNALETKINSTQVIRALVENLGTTFFPYVEQTFEAVSALFDYKYSRAVRGVAIECCQFLLLAWSELEQQEQLMGLFFPKFEAWISSLIKKITKIYFIICLNIVQSFCYSSLIIYSWY